MPRTVSMSIVSSGCTVLHVGCIDGDATGSFLWCIVNLLILLKLGPTTLCQNLEPEGKKRLKGTYTPNNSLHPISRVRQTTSGKQGCFQFLSLPCFSPTQTRRTSSNSATLKLPPIYTYFLSPDNQNAILPRRNVPPALLLVIAAVRVVLP